MNEKQMFDAAMKQILSLSKPEMQRRIEEDKLTREANPNAARIQAAMKRPTRKSEL